MRKWNASALKIPKWEFILSKTPTAIGLNFYRKNLKNQVCKRTPDFRFNRHLRLDIHYHPNCKHIPLDQY